MLARHERASRFSDLLDLKVKGSSKGISVVEDGSPTFLQGHARTRVCLEAPQNSALESRATDSHFG